MAINPAMLMLSAANPMLLPLAISQGHELDKLSRIASSGTLRHEHRGSIEHSFKPGSGEELRGIEVSAQRAFSAYSFAHSAFQEFVEASAAIIAEIDAAMMRKADEYIEEQQRKESESKASKSRLMVDTEAKLHELLGKKHNTWFHFGCYDAEIDGLRKILEREKEIDAESNWLRFSYPSSLHLEARNRVLDRRLSLHVERELKRLADLQAVAAVAHGTQHMSRDEVLEIHRIEQPCWLESQCIYKRVQAHLAKA